jgi:hypothetical protein
MLNGVYMAPGENFRHLLSWKIYHAKFCPGFGALYHMDETGSI